MACSFERLALEYDSDDIGELEEGCDDEALRGPAALEQYGHLMDEFLSRHATRDHAHEGGQAYEAAAGSGACNAMDPKRQDAAVAVAKVHRD